MAGTTVSEETVACPVCQGQVSFTSINTHLDTDCATKLDRRPSAFNKLAGVKPKPGAMDDSHAQGQPPAKKLKDAHPTPAAAQQTTTMRARRKVPLTQPLAERVRPRTLEEFIGQTRLVGEGTLLRGIVESDKVFSLILWGPPGCGKTTLARIIANMTKAHFSELSAVTSGVSDIRNIAQQAATRLQMAQESTILFVDEIHRFSKSQQDALLPLVEKGDVVLIGATTENPSFSCNSALLSRCRVFVFEKLTPEEIVLILKQAIVNMDINVHVNDETLHYLGVMCDGDARNALNSLDLAIRHSSGAGQAQCSITRDMVSEALQKAHLLYDKTGEEHYNCISALHKSMRGSDANAAIYWLARMLEAGEDPRYVARRMIRFAAEDVGLADPNALLQAVSAHQSAQLIGMPECTVILAQCAVYLARAPKSNALEVAYNKAKQCIAQSPAYPVPMHIRNAPSKLMKEIGYGKGYKYNPDYSEEECKDQTYLPDALLNTKFLPD